MGVPTTQTIDQSDHNQLVAFGPSPSILIEWAMGSLYASIFLTAAVFLGAATAAHAGMGVSFYWGPTKKCFDSKSPPMQLSGVPDGTAKFDIRMVDRNAIGFNHGGGKVTYAGKNSLPYGAFKYRGPCPPSGSHMYVFIVKALDARGKTLATAKASKKFP